MRKTGSHRPWGFNVTRRGLAVAAGATLVVGAPGVMWYENRQAAYDTERSGLARIEQGVLASIGTQTVHCAKYAGALVLRHDAHVLAEPQPTPKGKIYNNGSTLSGGERIANPLACDLPGLGRTIIFLDYRGASGSSAPSVEHVYYLPLADNTGVAQEIGTLPQRPLGTPLLSPQGDPTIAAEDRAGVLAAG